MTAVLHAQYSYTYISALDIKILENTMDRARNSQIVSNSLAVIIPKLEFGLQVLREHAKFDEPGEGFFQGLSDWNERLIANAYQHFRAYDVSPKPFSHPIAND
jgi:hypothetical protein